MPYRRSTPSAARRNAPRSAAVHAPRGPEPGGGSMIWPSTRQLRMVKRSPVQGFGVDQSMAEWGGLAGTGGHQPIISRSANRARGGSRPS
jgi:hypothetical protein